MVAVDKLKEMKVIGGKAYALGEVSGVEVDIEEWKVTHLRVKLTDEAATELGFKKRFRSSIVCMPVNLVTAVGDVVTIDKSIQELKSSINIVECKE